MHILLIGGTGNISAACAERFIQAGHQLSIVTRGRSILPAGAAAVVCDRNDPRAMANASAGQNYDVIINFLGFNTAQLETDRTVFAGRTAQYIFISSCTVYKKPHEQLPLTEDSPLGNSFSEYAQKKAACEQLLQEWHSAGILPVTIVRPSHTYSERWLPNPVSSAGFTAARRLLDGKPVFVPGDGQSLWTLTADTDFATGLAGLAGLPAAIGTIYHITSDEVLTWNQIYKETARALHVESPQIIPVPVETICQACPALTAGIKGDKASHAVFDNARIKSHVDNFQCRVPFRDGVARSTAWYLSHPDMMTSDPKVDEIFEQVLNYA